VTYIIANDIDEKQNARLDYDFVRSQYLCHGRFLAYVHANVNILAVLYVIKLLSLYIQL